MKNLIIVFFLISMIVSVNAFAEDEFIISDKKKNDIRISLGPSLWGGYTTYRIGFPVSDSTGIYSGHFPFSQLKFPIYAYSLSLKGEYNISDKLSVGLQTDRNITIKSGKMEDSDWLDNTGKLDVYSESDNEMSNGLFSSSYFFDINLDYNVYKKKKWWVTAGGGLIYRYFYFKCSDFVQVYPSGDYGSGADYGSGVGITYQILFLVPYIQVEGGYNITSNVEAAAGIGISPYLFVRDRDEHLARVPPIFADGEYHGNAGLLSFKLKYTISSNWFVSLEYDYLYIKAEGTQDNTQSGSGAWTTAADIESLQYMLILYAGYSF